MQKEIIMKKDRVYRLIIAGDIFPSEGNISLFEKGDTQTLFGSEICQLFSEADFSIVNLEGALTDSEEKQEKVGGPSLKAPQKTIEGIKSLGVNAVALANNHVTDYSNQGYFDTIKTLNESGIQYVGSGDDISSIKTYLTVVFENYKVCIYNVSETFFNSPDKETAGVNLYDEWVVLNEIKELKKKHDYLIVIYHGGAEYFPYPTPLTRKRFHRMADCGADFITAQHTHCIGCEEHYCDSYLLYGQGNFLFARQKSDITKSGLIIKISFNNGKIVIDKYLIRVNNNIVRFADKQDFSQFEERSRNVNDLSLIEKQYQKIKAREIMNRYLCAAKGSFPFRRVVLKFFPSKVRRNLYKSYSRYQILMNIHAMEHDRTNEDMLAAWKYILEQTE